MAARPSARPQANLRPSPLAVADATHEYPAPPARQSVSAAAPTPAAAVRRFAEGYVNWSATTIGADMSGLARQSVGQARSAMQLAAAETAQDYELRRGGVANHGTVEAVDRLAGRPNRYVVVTLEQTTATNTAAYQGLRPAWHVALAEVSRTAGGGWAVSAWQPEN